MKYFSTRYKRSSRFDAISSEDLTQHLGEASNSSQPQLEILPANTARAATNVYPLHDVEAQSGTLGWKATVRDQIEQDALKQ